MAFIFVGIIVLIGSFAFWYSRRNAEFFAAPKYRWWLLVFLSLALGVFSAVNSTYPSFAPRVTIQGTVGNCTMVNIGSQRRPNYYASFLVRRADGSSVHLQSNIVGPMCKIDNHGPDQRIYRIIYLQDQKRPLGFEAISIEVLSGLDTGWHKSLDARPFGIWLGVLLAEFLGCMGIVGTNYGNKAAFRRRRRNDWADHPRT